MKILVGENSKTDALINLAKDRKSIIVCMGHRECQRIYARAQELELSILYPITYTVFKEKHQSTHYFYLIDSIEDYLFFQFGERIKAITLSNVTQLDIPCRHCFEEFDPADLCGDLCISCAAEFKMEIC